MNATALQLERTAVGVLMGGVTWAELQASGLTASHFAHPPTRLVFEAVQALKRNNESADELAVRATAARIGGKEELVTREVSEILNFSFHPSQSFARYATEIKRNAAMRERQRKFEELSKRCADPKVTPAQVDAEVTDFLATATNMGGGYRTCAEDVMSLNERITAKDAGKRTTIVRTGVELLDAEVGGLRPTLTVIGGLPGQGKTALVATILGNLAKAGVKCGVFGLEDETQWLADRLVSREALIPLCDLDARKFNAEEQDRLQHALGRVHSWLENVEKEAPRARMKPAELVSRARDWVLNRGVKAIFVDHLGELDHGQARDRYDLSVGASLSDLRSIAVAHAVPVVVVAHLRRRAEHDLRARQAPMLSDFAESAYIERQARLALGVWQGPNANAVNVTVLKFNAGRAGRTLQLDRVAASALVSNRGGHIETQHGSAA